MNENTKITVVIPAYNEEECIGDLLSDLKEQSFRNFEVILIDDGCTDRTAEIAKKFNAKIFFSGKHNLAFNRNLGIRNAKGEIIVNLDADFRVNKDFLKEIGKCFVDEGVGGIRVGEKLSQETLMERLDYLRTFCKYGGVAQSVRVFRKGIFYDEELRCFGEDVSMNKKVVGRIAICKKAQITHHRFHTVREVARSWRLYPSAFLYIKKYEGVKSLWKPMLPLIYPLIAPFIAIQRLIEYKDLRALLIPFYDLVRTFAYIDGMLDLKK